ncbi:hypothetical protein COB72_08595 [bacterium]|nr:MAG: hypothetical protein COB72_08595 [bacterium]
MLFNPETKTVATMPSMMIIPHAPIANTIACCSIHVLRLNACEPTDKLYPLCVIDVYKKTNPDESELVGFE